MAGWPQVFLRKECEDEFQWTPAWPVWAEQVRGLFREKGLRAVSEPAPESGPVAEKPGQAITFDRGEGLGEKKSSTADYAASPGRVVGPSESGLDEDTLTAARQSVRCGCPGYWARPTGSNGWPTAWTSRLRFNRAADTFLSPEMPAPGVNNKVVHAFLFNN